MAKAKNKTAATEASVAAYLAAIVDEDRRKDCTALARLMAKATGEKPKMWGASIVGFGAYHYRYDSGREGDMCLVGFSSRKGDISIYLTASPPDADDLFARLGKHKRAKACLYVRRMSDVDQQVLAEIVAQSAAETRRRYR